MIDWRLETHCSASCKEVENSSVAIEAAWSPPPDWTVSLLGSDCTTLRSQRLRILQIWTDRCGSVLNLGLPPSLLETISALQQTDCERRPNSNRNRQNWRTTTSVQGWMERIIPQGSKAVTLFHVSIGMENSRVWDHKSSLSSALQGTQLSGQCFLPETQCGLR
ncbi:hypothetical protein AAHC03_019224 [Spirometra sp. Aus1]